VNEKEVNKTFQALENLYRSLPSTKGCLEHINKPREEGGCGAWCCLLPDQIVYTPSGPRTIQDIYAGMKVYTKGGVKRVLRSKSKLINDEIVVVKTGYGRCIKLTKEHQVYCEMVSRKNRAKGEFDFVESVKLQEGRGQNKEYKHYIYFPKISQFAQRVYSPVLLDLSDFLDVYNDEETGNIFNTYRKRGVVFNRIVNFDNDWAWILGLYLAEGTCNDSAVEFHINYDEKNIAQRIRDFAQKINARCTGKVTKGKSYTVNIFSSVFSKFMTFAGNKLCYKKRINEYILSRIIDYPNILQNIHDGYYAGDGTKGDLYTITTTSKWLAEQILFINILLDRFCGICASFPEKKLPFYACYSNSNAKFHNYIETDEYFAIPVVDVSYELYSGPVFDIEVEDEHSFCTSAGEVHNCKQIQPSVLYVEFLYTWKYILDNYDLDWIVNLIEKALDSYLSGVVNKGCIFLDFSSNLCSQHETRPLSCREYSITPEEEFNRKLVQLRIHYKDRPDAIFRDQCNLVSTEDGSKVTAKDTNKWWQELKTIEENFGIDKKRISDDLGGTYRTYPEHILMKVFSSQMIDTLQVLKQYGSEQEKHMVVKAYMEHVKVKLGKIIHDPKNNSDSRNLLR